MNSSYEPFRQKLSFPVWHQPISFAQVSSAVTTLVDTNFRPARHSQNCFSVFQMAFRVNA
jgi:hypothetical protein